MYGGKWCEVGVRGVVWSWVLATGRELDEWWWLVAVRGIERCVVLRMWWLVCDVWLVVRGR